MENNNNDTVGRAPKAIAHKGSFAAKVFEPLTRKEFWMQVLLATKRFGGAALLILVGCTLISFGRKKTPGVNGPPPEEGWFSQIFAPFTKKETWLKLSKDIAKNSGKAFLISMGSTFVQHGRKVEGDLPDLSNGGTQPNPAAQAFSNPQGFSRGYTPQTSYSSLNNPPVTMPPEGPWPGFGNSR